MRLGLLMRRVEGRPATQYNFHKIMSRVWLTCMVVTIPVVVFAPVFWVKIGILWVAEISYYANYATDTGAMAAANASTSENITAYAIGEAAEKPPAPGAPDPAGKRLYDPERDGS